jgi:hypothetical protein
MKVFVLLEFFRVPTRASSIICVTRRAYTHVLKFCVKNSLTHIKIYLFGEKRPFAFLTQTIPDDDEVSVASSIDELTRLIAFANILKSPRDYPILLAPPDGSLYAGRPLASDQHLIGLVEFARCLYARMLYFERTATPMSTIPVRAKTLYVRGGGQHGTIVWGGASALLRHLATTPFEYFAGDSFGAAVAVASALDPTGERLFYERMVETCTRMKLDEVDRPLNRDVAIEFVQSSLHEYIDQTLGELNLPVDIVVSSISRGLEVAVLNKDTAPDVKLGDALIASMSIPVVVGEHFGYFDGGLTAWDYVNRLGADSVVVGLSTADMPLEKLQLFGPLGDAVLGIISMWCDFSGQNSEHAVSYKPYKQFCIPTRDTSVSVAGGSIGTTSWHVHNFQHGFDTVLENI